MSHQVDDFSYNLPIHQNAIDPSASLLADSAQGARPHYHPNYLYSSQFISESGARSTLIHSSSTSGSDPSNSSRSLDYTCSSQATSSNNSSANSNETSAPGQAPWDYTPSTVPDSLGRTPPPMATPPNMSFSNHLAYIDGKLLQFASSRFPNDTPEESPRFPPGVSPVKGAKRAAPVDFFVPVTQSRLPVPKPRVLGRCRTHSKILREQNQGTRSDTTDQDVANQSEFEQEIKRRKLRQQDSNASAHTFSANEPASLRKARSLIVAGSVDAPPRPSATADAQRAPAMPIIVPTIWPRDAAISRLRCLMDREGAQRVDDAYHRMTSQRPSSLEFDGNVHFDATNWLFSVQAPPEDVYKPIRHHLRTSIETRIHAVLLFSRYAARHSCAGFNPFMQPPGNEEKYERRVRTRLVHEIALGCLAIAAKFHRDFLPPLLPMMAEQFQGLLGEDQPISFDDLELVQNKIMRSFNYILYQPTPQAYLQEFWMICPSLQCIQDGTFELYRTCLVDQLLQLLEACLLEFEAIDYPMSCLTAAALLEALHLRQLHQQCNVHSEGRYWHPLDESTALGLTVAPRVCVACVNAEICAAMHIHPDSLKSCRDWVMSMWVGVVDED